MEGLAGRSALVTGAAGGIGAAICRRLVRHGARVVGLDRTLPADEAAVPPGVVLVQGDVRQVEDIRRALRTARDRHGEVSLLANNAGVVDRGPLREQDTAAWDQVLETNLTGAFLVLREAAESLVAHGDAAVVMTASVSGWIGGGGMAAYSASKAALQSLGRVAALELAGKVRVNAVAPGIIATNMTVGSDAPDEAEVARAVARIPMARFGRPEEVAAAVAYLLSSDASYVTGATIVVDGGFSVA